MNLEEFDPYYQRFKRALSWIQDEYRRRGFSPRRILTDHSLQKDLKEFDLNVINPMEAAWAKLSSEEKNKFSIDREPGSD